MFESTLFLDTALVSTVALFLYMMTKALIQAWKNPDLFVSDSEGRWGWWVEVQTASPSCRYYFGPFSDAAQADRSKSGYVQDLIEENAQQVTAKVLWCRPRRLTEAATETLAQQYA